jgi:chemotaxis protein methyltransferase CheR
MLDVCLEEEPLLIEAQLLKASFAEEAGDLADAERAYRKALYVDRNCSMAHFHLALVQQLRGDAAGARRSLRTVLALAQDKDAHSIVEHGDGVCYGRLREMVEVILDFQF